MTISIKATNLELTPALQDYTEKRLRTIEKYTGGEPSVTVELAKTTAHHKQGEIFSAEVRLTTVLGKNYFASSQKVDLYEAIDDVRNDIVRELSSAKGKRETLFRRGAQKIKIMMKGFRK